jgi:hypothetical protein
MNWWNICLTLATRIRFSGCQIMSFWPPRDVTSVLLRASLNANSNANPFFYINAMAKISKQMHSQSAIFLMCKMAGLYTDVELMCDKNECLSRRIVSRFLRQSLNIATLKLGKALLDTEACSVLGNWDTSKLVLCLDHCKIESPDVFGDGMRQNYGPNILTMYDTPFSFGSLTTNTKLKSLNLKRLYYQDSEAIEWMLPFMTAQGLRLVEFHSDFYPNAWLLSLQPSVQIVRFKYEQISGYISCSTTRFHRHGGPIDVHFKVSSATYSQLLRLYEATL